MKLKDLINATNKRQDWISIYSNWFVMTNGEIVFTQPTKNPLTLETDVTVCYNWFHHCNPSVDIGQISNAIRNHDYATFVKWYDMLAGEPFTYLPSEAHIFVDDIYVGRICVAYSKDIFSLITDEDHECG